MNRRDTIKSLLLGSVAAGIALKGCAPEASDGTIEKTDLPLYGRNEKELIRDQEILKSTFLNKHEMETIAILCDIILPANEKFGAATDAGVHEFIAFIIKDLPYASILPCGVALCGLIILAINYMIKNLLPAQILNK